MCLIRLFLYPWAEIYSRIFLGLAGSLGICGMSFTGSPTRSALSTAALRWFSVAWKVWHHPISGNSVAPLLLFSVISHYALLPRRICWSPGRGLLSDSAFSVAGPTAWNGLLVALRLTPVAHSPLFLSGLKTTLFDRGWAGSAPE